MPLYFKKNFNLFPYLKFLKLFSFRSLLKLSIWRSRLKLFRLFQTRKMRTLRRWILIQRRELFWSAHSLTVGQRLCENRVRWFGLFLCLKLQLRLMLWRRGLDPSSQTARLLLRLRLRQGLLLVYAGVLGSRCLPRDSVPIDWSLWNTIHSDVPYRNHIIYTLSDLSQSQKYRLTSLN